MAKVKISKQEIAKMLMDQLEVSELEWDKNGNVTVEIDFDALKKKEKIVERIIERDKLVTIPVYGGIWIDRSKPYKPWPYWTVTSATSKSQASLTYSSSSGGV